MGLGTALKVFWIALTKQEVAARFVEMLDRPQISAEKSEESKPCERQESRVVKSESSPSRSDAIELLAALQREARFVDFVKESLDGADDADVGAIARDVHNRCAATLERFFAIRPLADVAEGETIQLSAKEASNASRVRLSCSSSSIPEEGLRVKVTHSGWKIEKLSLPRWQGRSEDAFVLASIEASVDR